MKSKKSKKQHNQNKKSFLYALLLILPFVVVFVAQIYFTRENKQVEKKHNQYQAMIKKLGELPDYAYSSAQSLAGYKIALRKSSLLKKLKCFCNCESMGMENLNECFIDNEQYNNHASQCDICNNEAIDADQWQKDGVSEKEIIKKINQKYGKT